MKRCRTFWGCLILLFVIQCVPQVSCQLPYLERCQVTVEPSPVFLVGSNLTVHCHFKSCHREYEQEKYTTQYTVGNVQKFANLSPVRSYRVSLELNGMPVKSRKEIDCKWVTFHLVNVRTPKSSVVCKLEARYHTKIGCGEDLNGGRPPPKPENIVCETTRAWDQIRCSWPRGAGIYLPTSYRLSVHSENGSLVYSNQTQGAQEMTIPRGIVHDDEKYLIDVTARNPLGSSRSEPLRLCVNDMVIPDTPNITHVEFEGSPITAALRWNTTGSSEELRGFVRFSTREGFWEMTPKAELGEGLIRVRDLAPLTEYRFQVRTCDLASRQVCSRWSSTVARRSPGKSPTRQLCVWRTFVGRQTMSVLWKPPPPDDYSGEVQEYKVFLGRDRRELPTASSRCSVDVPAEDRTVSVSAVTSYGDTPPAPVPLGLSGASGPVLREWTPAPGGDAVFISWSRSGIEPAATQGELLYYVLEWISVPATQLQWQRVERDRDNATITDLREGVRYNVSLYSVTTGGVSAPSSHLVYSRQLNPASGPVLFVLSHEAQRVWVQWDELPVDLRRGFITHYNLYIHTLDSNNPTTNRVEVPGPGSGRMWMPCPDGALTLQLTASTSVGEGPRGPQVVSLPAAPAVSLIITVVFILILFITVTANLMCWGCVRKRIKQRCMSCGPAWLVQTLPKPGNSNAIRLLQQDEGELTFSSTDGEPLLSPISLVSSLVQKDVVYPSVQVQVTDPSVGQASVETPLSSAGRSLTDWPSSYKPQISVFPSKREGEDEMAEVEEEGEELDGPVSEEEVVCSRTIGGLLGVFLSRVEVDLSDPDLGSTFELLRPKVPDGLLSSAGDMAEGTEMDRPALETQRGDGFTANVADACSAQDAGEAALTGGYFPQLASFCDGKL